MKIYLDSEQRGETKASVDGKSVPYGKDNAEEFTQDEVERLVQANSAFEDLIQVVGKGKVPTAPDDDEDTATDDDSNE